MRLNVEETLDPNYKEAKVISQHLNVEECIQRTCGIQRNRKNVPLNKTEEYYRKAVIIPFVDNGDSVKSLQNVLPTKTVGKPFAEIVRALPSMLTTCLDSRR